MSKSTKGHRTTTRKPAGRPILSDHERVLRLIERFAAGLLDEQLTLNDVDGIAIGLEAVADAAVAELKTMLASGQEGAQFMAAALAMEMCDDRLVEPLWKALNSRNVKDEQKAHIAHALSELGVPVDDEAYRRAIADPEALLKRSEEGLKADMLIPDRLQHILVTMAELPPDVLASYVRDRIVPVVDRSFLLLLTGLVYFRDDQVILAAIEALERLKEPGLLPLFQERARYDPSEAVREEARKAATRLQARVGDAPPQPWLAPPVLPLVSCQLSSIDGSGGQVLFVVRRNPGGHLAAVDFMFNDHEGLKDCFQVSIDDESFEQILSDFAPIQFVEVGLELARQEAERGVQCALEAGRRPAYAFMVWRTWLEGPDPRTVTVTPLPKLIASQRPGLLAKSQELLKLDEFDAWYFNPGEVEQFMPRFERLRRRGQAQAGHRLYEMLIDRVLEHMLSAQFNYRRLIPGRLRRQAWLLAQIYDETRAARMALAAAGAMEEGLLLEHPLLRGMADTSLFHALDGEPDEDEWSDDSNA